jgi:hypothetical protein
VILIAMVCTLSMLQLKIGQKTGDVAQVGLAYE